MEEIGDDYNDKKPWALFLLAECSQQRSKKKPSKAVQLYRKTIDLLLSTKWPDGVEMTEFQNVGTQTGENRGNINDVMVEDATNSVVLPNIGQPTSVESGYIIGVINEDGTVTDSSGQNQSAEYYLNKITPVKRPPARDEISPPPPPSPHDEIPPSARNEQPPHIEPPAPVPNQNIQKSLDEIVSEACSQISSKRTKTVKGEKCPITACTTRIIHKKNLKRHLRQCHGELQKDGSYGLPRYICTQTGCSTECLNKVNIKLHQVEQHKNKPQKYEVVSYKIDPDVQAQLEPYFTK